MVCRFARDVTICLNAIFIIMGISISATGGYLLSVVNKYGDIPGAPAKTALFAMISLGVVLCFLACLGMQGASMRKTKGSEKRGLCLLIIYAVFLGLIIIAELIIGVVVFVWIGGSLGPISEKIESSQRASKLTTEGGKQADNFINCLYNECCQQQDGLNVSMFAAETCRMNSKNRPDAKGEVQPIRCEGTCEGEEARASVKQACKALGSRVLSKEQCYKGIDEFRSQVSTLIMNNLRPIGIACCVIGGLQLILFIFAILQICWCCGKSDDPDEGWYDDDYEDDYYRTKVVPY